MGTSARATTPSAVYTTPAFWERFWRTGGIQSIACFILAYFIYGDQPRVGAAADAHSCLPCAPNSAGARGRRASARLGRPADAVRSGRWA